MDQIEEDDENGFYVGILLAVRGANKRNWMQTRQKSDAAAGNILYRLFLTTISKFRH